MFGMITMLRFLFINTYAFLLLIIAAAIVFVPSDILLILLKGIGALLCVIAAINILLQWKRKKRMIKVLLRRNASGFNLESFKPYMETFCSQLVVVYVLKKIGHTDKLAELYTGWCEENWKN
jgi:hypothetical protein